MKKLDILKLPQIANDKKLKDAAIRYKSYNTIRRDLRKAHQICEYAINVNQNILNDLNFLSQAKDSVFLVNGSLMYAVVLYARWFKATKGKLTLNPKDFFSHGSEEKKQHEDVVRLRDQYVAHYELDIYGGDNIWAQFSSDGCFETLWSDWEEKQFDPNFMNSFLNCIRVVHNKIDAEILPDVEKNLIECLKEICV